MNCPSGPTSGESIRALVDAHRMTEATVQAAALVAGVPSDRRDQLGRALVIRGNVELLRGDAYAAHDHYEKALVLLEDEGERAGCERNAGAAAFQIASRETSGSTSRAEWTTRATAYLTSSTATFRALFDPGRARRSVEAHALGLARLGETESAVTMAREAANAEVGSESDMKKARSHLMQAEILRKAGLFGECRQQYERAKSVLPERESILHIQVMTGLAEMWRLKDRNKSLKWLLKAARMMDRALLNLGPELNNVEYRRRLPNPAAIAAVMLVEAHGRLETSRDVDQVEKALDLMERARSAQFRLELQQSGASPTAAEKDAEVPELDRIRQSIDVDEVIVSYTIVDDYTAAWIALTRDGVKGAGVLAGAAGRIHEQIVNLRACIDADCALGKPVLEQRPRWNAAAGVLGLDLFPPELRATLEQLQPRRITVVPSGELHSVPFSLLTVWGDALVSRFDVGALLQCGARAVRGSAVRDGGVDGYVLNPDGSIGPGPVMTLKDAVARDGAREIQPSELACSFSRTVATHALRSLTVLAHGVFWSESPLDSAVLLGDGGCLRAADIVLDGEPLLALVASVVCESATSRVLPGDAVYGLSRGWTRVSKAVVAALWRVQDVETTDLMALFFDHYFRDGDAVSALSTAQRAFLNKSSTASGTPPYISDHPYSWAGLVVYQ